MAIRLRDLDTTVILNKLGVGPSNPQREIQIHNPSAASTFLQITNSTSTSGSNGGFQFGVNSAGDGQIVQRESGKDIVFYRSGSTEVLRIKSDGKIVIPTASLPTSDPASAGTLWRDGTDVKISLG